MRDRGWSDRTRGDPAVFSRGRAARESREVETDRRREEDTGRMSLSVASVTVAYNAAKVLPRQIDALRRQTRALQEIIVVDNASSDGTDAMLAERYPQVTLLQM